MVTLTISKSGRITIPAAMRRKLGWEPGTRLHVIEQEDGRIVLRRVRSVAELGGIFKDHAIPGTTWEQEREAAEQSIADEAMEGM